MLVEIWSDIACPWCHIGKARFEAALAEYEHKDSVEVVWRSYELQPDAPRTNPGTTTEALKAKYGRSAAQVAEMLAQVTEAAAGEGLEYHLDRAVAANTFDAHRLVHLAGKHGLGHQVMTRLMRAYQSDGLNVADHDTLARLAAEAGLAEDDVRGLLRSDDYAAEVRADQRRGRAFGVTGVPFFVFDELHGASGAQPKEFFLAALRQLGPRSKPVTMLGATAEGVCDDDGCVAPQA